MCYVVYKTGSIFPAMMMHFINNAFSVLISYYPQQIGEIFPIMMQETFSVSDILLLLGAGLILLGIGLLFLKNKQGMNNAKKSDKKETA